MLSGAALDMHIKSGTEILRKQNRILVLSALRNLGPASHTEIASWSGLSSATVTVITSELEHQNILERLPQEASSGRGRPRVLFRQNPDCAYAALIRITSEEIEFSLIDYLGTLKDRFSEKRRENDQDIKEFGLKVKAGLKKLVSRAKLPKEKILRISITSKGLVAHKKPVLLWSAILGDTKLDFEALLKPQWKANISLKNETGFVAQAISQSARSKGSFSPLPSVAVLSLGHSIGFGMASQDMKDGGVTAQNILFGHMTHEKDGPLCRCGQRGCIEAFSGFYGILRSAFGVDENTIPAKFIPIEEMDKIANLARNGDHAAEYAFRRAGEVLGIGISRMFTFYAPVPITITGPGIRYLDLMLPSIKSHIEDSLFFRFEDIPEISIVDEEGPLVFDGNLQASVYDLDQQVVKHL